MPNVKGKKFPYTFAGKIAAAEEAKKAKKGKKGKKGKASKSKRSA
jgi:hypothetical protein